MGKVIEVLESKAKEHMSIDDIDSLVDSLATDWKALRGLLESLFLVIEDLDVEANEIDFTAWNRLTSLIDVIQEKQESFDNKVWDLYGQTSLGTFINRELKS